HGVLSEPAAARADVDGDVDAVRQRGDEVRMDRLKPRELVPLLGFEVVDERPEQGTHQAIAHLAGWDACHLVYAHGVGQPRDVVDAEMSPAGRSLLDRLFVVHRTRRSD